MASNRGSSPLTVTQKIALRDKWLEELYTLQGQAIWIRHARKQGWSLDEQLIRLEQLVTGSFA